MSMTETIAPHGGQLVDLMLTGREAAAAAEEAEHLPKLEVTPREQSDLEMLAVGALSPLTGFIGREDYDSILDSMHLTNGLPWAIPVTLSLDEAGAKRLGGAGPAARSTAGPRGHRHPGDLPARPGTEADVGLPDHRARPPRGEGPVRRRRLLRGR